MRALPPGAQNQNRACSLVTGPLCPDVKKKKKVIGMKDMASCGALYSTYDVLQLVRRPQDRTRQ